MGQKKSGRINEGFFFYKKMYGGLARRPKQSDRTTEVAIRWGYIVRLKPRMPSDFTNETLHIAKFISVNHGQILSWKVP